MIDIQENDVGNGIIFCIRKENKMAKQAKYISPDNRIREIIKDIQNLAYSHGVSDVFTDYITLISCAISNRVDKLHYEEREELYLRTIKKYSREESVKIMEIHKKVVDTLSQTLFSQDVLGEMFHALNLSNEWNGQFFTPFHIADMMAKMMIGPQDEAIKEKGYITLNEPTCGSGAMIIAAAKSLVENNLSPSNNMCVLAVDNDIRCAMMTYIQLSYLGIPAVVVHGDTLRVQEYTRFYTPIYMLGGWLWKEPMSITDKLCEDDIKLRKMVNPVWDLLKSCLEEEVFTNE